MQSCQVSLRVWFSLDPILVMKAGVSGKGNKWDTWDYDVDVYLMINDGLGTENPMGTRSVEPESQAIWRLGDAEQGVMLSGGLMGVMHAICISKHKDGSVKTIFTDFESRLHQYCY